MNYTLRVCTLVSFILQCRNPLCACPKNVSSCIHIIILIKLPWKLAKVKGAVLIEHVIAIYYNLNTSDQL